MNHKYAFIFAASVAMGTSLSANAQIAGPYTPEQVYSAMYDAIRQAVGVYPTTPGQSAWVSLSTIGSIVNPNDPGLVNDLANFCPPASPVIAAYGREPKLDVIV